MYTTETLSNENNQNQKTLNNTFKRKLKLKKIKNEDPIPEYKTGRWSQQEQRNFINACLIYGSDWKKVFIQFSIFKLLIIFF